MNYGFANYTVNNFGNKGTEVCKVKILNGQSGNIVALTKDNTAIVIDKKEKENIKTHVNLPKELSAPIKKGQQIGEIIITLNGETIAKSNLIANKDVKKMSAANYFVNMFTHLFK